MTFVLYYYLSTKTFTWLAIVALEVFNESNNNMTQYSNVI